MRPLLALLLLASCTPIGHVKVDGWPVLAVSENVVANNVMRDRCSRYMPAGVSPMGCAEINIKARTCDIWLSADFPSPDNAIHERLHCDGYDHPGGTFLKGLLNGSPA